MTELPIDVLCCGPFASKFQAQRALSLLLKTVFHRVIGDAALIAEVIDVDTHGRDPRAVPGAPAPPRADAGAFSSSLPPTQREIEGAGGEMWYEARHIGAGRAA